MSSIVITVKAKESQQHLKDKYQLDANRKNEEANALARLFQGIAGGVDQANIDVQTGSADPVAASGTFTLDTVVATDVVIVGPITFTGTDTPSTNLHFDTSLATDALIAADIASTINDHPTVGQVVTASSDGDVVTVTAKQKGVVGNFINISSPDSTITASGANLADGTGGVAEAAVNYNLGLS